MRRLPAGGGQANGGSLLGFMPKNLKRYVGRGDLHFIHFTCYERRALLGSVKARNLAVRIPGEVRARYRFALLGYVSFNVASCARRRSQSTAGTIATCGYSTGDEYLHSGGSDCMARSEQQSCPSRATSAGGLALMAPRGPSILCKSLFRK